MTATWVIALLVLLAAPLRAPAEESAAAPPVSGSVTVGGGVAAVEDSPLRVREYSLDREEFEAGLLAEIWGWSGDAMFDVRADYANEQDFGLDGRIRSGNTVDARFKHRSFHRWLDHDGLSNLTWRERVGADSLGNDVPGGKMLTSEDLDPEGVYSFRHSQTEQDVAIAIPGLTGTAISAGWRDQRREGAKQVRGVDHCANCHVRGQRGLVDEQTRELTLGLSTERSRLSAAYEFSARDYDNRAAAATNRFMQARHPANGGSIAEFESRLIYDNDVLAVSQTPDSERRAHAVRLRAELPKGQSARASYRQASVENETTELAVDSRAATLSWAAPFGKRTRVTAGVTRRDVEADSYLVDLPNWREGRPGGGQDFDWTRESAYDREEWLASANASFRWRPGQTFRLDYRLRTTDRDHVEVDPNDPDPDAFDETRTTSHRVRASWLGRIAASARSRVSVEWERVRFPFVAVRGLCEEAQGESLDPLSGNSFVYYFQRERFGTGGALPRDALRANANLSWSLSPRVSLNGWLTLADEKNDEMNVYEFERTVANPGLAVVAFPRDDMSVTGGMAFQRIESSALLCIPVFDG